MMNFKIRKEVKFKQYGRQKLLPRSKKQKIWSISTNNSIIYGKSVYKMIKNSPFIPFQLFITEKTPNNINLSLNTSIKSLIAKLLIYPMMNQWWCPTSSAYLTPQYLHATGYPGVLVLTWI